MGFDTALWSLLSKRSCSLFGQECAIVSLWTIFGLLLRTILYLTNTERVIPRGFVYAFPYLIETLAFYAPILRRASPILSVRISESLLISGKPSFANIMVIIPAHFIGSLVGVTLLNSFLPFLPVQIFSPLVAEASPSPLGFVIEVCINFAYISVLLILPYLLEVNHIKRGWTSLALVPFFCIPAYSGCCSFNISLVYALWYVNTPPGLLKADYDNLPAQIIGPIVAAVLAAALCNIYFPDDPTSWTRVKKTISR